MCYVHKRKAIMDALETYPRVCVFGRLVLQTNKHYSILWTEVQKKPRQKQNNITKKPKKTRLDGDNPIGNSRRIYRYVGYIVKEDRDCGLHRVNS